MDKHRTQISNTQNERDDGAVYSPIEDLQRAEGNAPLNREAFRRVGGLPMTVQVIGYVLFGLLFAGIGAVLLLNVL
ncbi:hypothetical protein ACFQPF_12055 [Fictibacillus iocasae]|uniref:Uncharacterized protein n=1 Tax=Fictibacillus iocasae TaxID=2715437 RepID=A0ABW2NP37_9BACL